jgi:DNA polymerase I-like protein with 3'-5' exonuclease and polymerase domains
LASTLKLHQVKQFVSVLETMHTKECVLTSVMQLLTGSPVEQEVQLWLAFQRLVDDPNVRLVTQNGMYDFSWTMVHNRLVASGVWFDTMLAHHTLYPSMPHNLGFLTTQYTTHPFYKDEGKLWKESGDINAEWRYNVKDVCIMLKCQQQMMKELEAAEPC